jgi:hypothetical protein
MNENPYAPPRADINQPPSPSAVAGSTSSGAPAEQLPPELEARAMQLLGQMRSRATGVAFGISWAGSILVLFFVVGLIPGLIVGAILGGVISKAYVKSQTPALVEKVSRQLGIKPGLFNPDRYLI